jgi:predicted dehydrogenase
MKKTFRVAIIGRTGKGNYGHGIDTVWLDFPDRTKIIAIADENSEGRAAASRRLHCDKTYADFRQMLEREKPDIVAICDRWLDQHPAMVIAAANAKAHIFLEKPICPSLEQADAMIDACDKNHVHCAIAHQSRYTHRAARIRELLNTGKIGAILEVRGRGKEDQRGGGDDLMVLGTHVLDLMRFFVGDPKWCYARIQDKAQIATKQSIHPGGEGMGPVLGDQIHATYGFEKGIIGSFSTYKAREGVGARFGLTILGSKGTILVGTGGLPPAFLIEDPSWGLKGQAKWQAINSGGLGVSECQEDASLAAGNRLIVEDLFEAIEKDRPPLGSLRDGRWALEMILAPYASHLANAPVVFPMIKRGHPLA